MSPAARRSAADRFCAAVDALNARVGLVCSFAIAVVTGVVIWEIVARGAFARPTVWANETTVYLSAIAYGWEMAWASIQQGETTGTPWNPPIWPVKLAIPLAGLLLLLQGVANLLRDLGIAAPRAPE